MKQALDYAKYFIKNGFDAINCIPNTKDGNMKINKLCVFANMISIAEYNTPLFNDEILAFENGCVIENIRLAYRNNYHSLLTQCRNSHVIFSTIEQEIIMITTKIFGALTAKELSEIQHQFSFWQNSYEHGTNTQGKHNKANSIITSQQIAQENEKIKIMIDTFRENQKLNNHSLIINGIKFIYNPNEIRLNKNILAQLREVTSYDDAKEEGVFSIYLENGELVIS